MADALQYWRSELEGSKPAQFLPDFKSSAESKQTFEICDLSFDQNLLGLLEVYCHTNDALLEDVLQAAFRATHYRLTGVADATIGLATTNDIHCIRTSLDDATTIEDLIKITATKSNNARRNGYPYATLCREGLSSLTFEGRDTHQLRTGFTFQKIEQNENDTVSLQQAGLESRADSFHIQLHLTQASDHLHGWISFASHLFHRATIRCIASTFQDILQQISVDSPCLVDCIPLKIGLAELERLGLSQAPTSDYPRDASIPMIFKHQVSLSSNKIAVKDSTGSVWTYGELDGVSDLFANKLRQRQMPPEALVGVLAPRSNQTIAALLGILKAGLAYLPLDINAPEGRIADILSLNSGKTLVLVGDGQSFPSVNPNEAEFVFMSDFQVQSSEDTIVLQNHIEPSASSLAYVMYTSGSTGRPKGVMIEHRGIVRLVKNTNVISPELSSGVVAHLGNLVFDASTWEIFTALLNGGTLICIDYLTLLDIDALHQIFRTEAIQATLLTPAFLKQCLAVNEDLISQLDILLVGGDRFDVHDAIKVRAILKSSAVLLNACGPAENTVASVVFSITANEKCINGVPVGKSVTNSGVVVMDSEQNVVGPGVIGELVLTGDGLARGYTNSELNEGHFIEINVNGTATRAYRTGDCVRQRPIDGEMEFFGRLDYQIKIRGHRIELAEIDRILLNQSIVSDAVTLSSTKGTTELELVSFVTIKSPVNDDDDAAQDHVKNWGDVFDNSAYTGIGSIQLKDIGRDFESWTSMYDGKLIDVGEMNEWLDDTIASICRDSPKNVLEIGFGTGMILFNICDQIESYVGIDPSNSAVAFVNNVVKQQPDLVNRVQVHCASASDAAQFASINTPDTVIINSVAQYFPSCDYLRELVEALLQVDSVQRIFFGDMRSYALYKEFRVERAMHEFNMVATRQQICRRIAELEDIEEEFLVDPSFFTSLPGKLPERVRHVEILPKRMEATNELSCYRYAAVIHTKQSNCHPVDVPGEWHDFVSQQLDRQQVTHLLQSCGSGQLAITNIPNEKIVVAKHVVHLLHLDGRAAIEKIDWHALRQQLPPEVSGAMSALELARVAEECGYRVELSYANQRAAHGHLDAVFYKGDERRLYQFPKEVVILAQKLSTNPVQQRQAHDTATYLHAALRSSLPSYMVPNYIEVLDSMPVNPNGKVDRKALEKLAVDVAPITKRFAEMTTPRNELEQFLCDELLALLRFNIGTQDNFFDLGGHSLIATRLVSRINQKLHVRATVSDIFSFPKVADLASHLGQLVALDEYVGIPSLKYQGPVEQSFAQSRLFFLERLYPDSDWYLVPMTLRIKGSLDLDALRSTMLAIEQRHESLRTVFEEHGGRCFQVVHPFTAKPLEVVPVSDEEELLERLNETQRKPFHISTEAGWRVELYQLGISEFVLSTVMHHIITDGWSLEILKREIATFYNAARLGKDPLSVVTSLPVHYRDFTIWQKQPLQEAEHQKQLKYWTKILDGSQPATFLYDKARPAVPSGAAEVHELYIDGELYQSLKAFCKDKQITPYVALFAAFRATHFLLTGASDATIGTPSANRNREELEDIIGFFVNMQCIRSHVSKQSFASLVQQIRKSTAEAATNQDLPFERLVAELMREGRDISRNPLVQIVFAFHERQDNNDKKLDGLETTSFETLHTTRFDLEFHLFHEEKGLRGSFVFAKDLMDIKTVSLISETLQIVLQQVIKNPELLIGDIPLTSFPLVMDDWQLGVPKYADYPRDHSIVSVFKEQVMMSGNSIAVKDSNREVSYLELDGASDAIAHQLSNRRLEPESLIAVLAPRSCDTVMAILGILKANLAYVPLDINASIEDTRSALQGTSGPRIVLFGYDSTTNDVNVPETEFIPISSMTQNCNGHSTKINELPQLSPKSLAAVLFTPASDSKPMGVMIEHRGIVRLAKSSYVPALEPGKRTIAHLSNITSNNSIWEIFSCLLNGGQLLCVDHRTVRDLPSLCQIFWTEKINSAFLKDDLLRKIIRENSLLLRGLDLLLSDGKNLDLQEKLDTEHLTRGRTYLVHSYAENTGITTIHPLRYSEGGRNGLLMGQAIDNSGVMVVDLSQRPVPPGVVGELVVTGDGIARGYTNQASDKGGFFSISIRGASVRAYRTGDYARYSPIDGQLEYIGRMNDHFGTRGPRVVLTEAELAEVEHVLIQHEQILTCVAVLMHVEGKDDVQLVAYIKLHAEPDTAAAALEEIVLGLPDQKLESHLYSVVRTKLPTYMVPSNIIVANTLPTDVNGEPDRGALSELVLGADIVSRVRERVAPGSPTEVALCQYFSDVLNIHVGTEDNFFHLGGHSLLAVRLCSRINKELDANISVRDLFTYPVISELAEYITSRKSLKYVAIPRTELEGPVEQSYAQGRLWFLDQLYPDSAWYLIPLAIRMKGMLHIDALRLALAAVEKRHETLRTTFQDQEGVSVQVVHPYRERLPEIINMDSWDCVVQKLEHDHAQPFDLTKTPGWRVEILKVDDTDHVLSIVMHHIIGDGWSVNVLQKDIAELYSAAVRGESLRDALRPLPIQYRDFSVWQRQDTQLRQHEEQLQYWRKQLQDNQPASFLCDKVRPKILSGKAQSTELSISGSLYSKLEQFCKRYQTTVFVVLLAAFRITHFRLTGAVDATVGTPIANRNRQELEDLIGFFVNLQCLRTKIEPEETTFSQLVQQVGDVSSQASANQDVPFERVVAEMLPGHRDLSRNPLAQVAFAVHSQENLGQLPIDGLQTELVHDETTTRFDLELHFFQKTAGLQGLLVHAEELFFQETITSLLSIFEEVLESGLDNPDALVSTMFLERNLAGLDRFGLANFHPTKYPRESNIPALFRQQAFISGESIAVTDSCKQLTYNQLNDYSDLLAETLIDRRLPPETLIGTFVPRSCEAVIAFLGILKANLAYLPLDVNAPRARTESILNELPEGAIVLLGPGIEAPRADKCLDFVPIISLYSDTESLPDTSVWIEPTATSLAYIMYTSGSTGKPKGIMAEHRGIVRLVKNTNVTSASQVSGVIAHMSNLAFDAATWEIYTALLNGGQVICIDYMTVLDFPRLSKAFVQHSITVSFITVALLRQILSEFPTILTNLDLVLSGGEKMPVHDAIQAQSLVRGDFYNVYGPTENTSYSTLYKVSASELGVNGVPIGRSISHSAALVMDSNQQVVPLGVIGELVVVGDGVARGYKDKKLNSGRFFVVNIGGQQLRAYRTGDLVRYRVSDGQLEFFGRMDDQVKIRGHRVELAEIEHTLQQHPTVADSVAIVIKEGADMELVSFVTLLLDEKVTDDDASGHSGQVENWTSLFDADVYANLQDIDMSDLGRDFHGWKSMYSKELIDKQEMGEWLDDTIASINMGGKPETVLEIGSGTGMILFNLDDGLKSYLGLDLSATAVSFTKQMSERVDSLQGRVDVKVGAADEVSSLFAGQSADVAVINSVAQYFPSSGYLRALTEDLLRFEGMKRIFFGDIRSFALYQEFGVTKALYDLRETASKEDVRREILRMESSEEELLVDPAFFTGLCELLPDLVSHVEIVPKVMRATNELSCYRYAAIIHTTLENRVIQDIEAESWVNYQERGLDRRSLLSLLQASSSEIVAVSAIPYSKIALERAVLNSLGEETKSDQWLRDARMSLNPQTSMSPLEIVETANQAGYKVQLSWARQRTQCGAFDVVFHHIQEANPLFRFPTDHKERSFRSYTTQPLQKRESDRIEQDLRSFVQQTLPDYMVPSRVRVLDKMPLNVNAKADRKKLAEISLSMTTERGPRDFVEPKTETQRLVCECFSAVLGGILVGITDNFFEIGGHSLLAMRLLATINKTLGWILNVQDIYRCPTPEFLCSADFSSGSKKHFEIYSQKPDSKATIILIHAFMGQGGVYSDLRALLDECLDIIIIHDPFFARMDGPLTVKGVASLYIESLKQILSVDKPVFLCGYSYGGLVALDMAAMWEEAFQKPLTSLIELDPGPYEILTVTDEVMKEEIEYGRHLFGVENERFTMRQLQKLAPLFASLQTVPRYDGIGLYVPTLEAKERGAVLWWNSRFPRLDTKMVVAPHNTMIEKATVGEVAAIFNEHILRVLEDTKEVDALTKSEK